MTTIAVNLCEGTASSDSKLNGDNFVPMLCTKMWTTKQGDLFLESGHALGGIHAREWAETRWSQDTLMDVWDDMPESYQFFCVLIQTDGRVFILDEDLQAMEVYDDKITLGSGAEYARGALDAGATTAQAVEIAIRHDSNSGGPVQTTLLPFKRKAPG